MTSVLLRGWLWLGASAFGLALSCETASTPPFGTTDGAASGGRATTAPSVAGSSSHDDLASCASSFLITRESLELHDQSRDAAPVCRVERDQAVSLWDPGQGEVGVGESGWLRVRYELCQGWVDSAKLRCPEPGERSSWMVLPVPYHNQVLETDPERWAPYLTCGPTALTMILDYLGFEADVNAVVARLADIDPKAGGFDANCAENPVCASGGAVAVVANQYCEHVIARDNWTQRELISSIDEREPVLALVSFGLVPGGAGHAITIVGYLDGGDRVVYHDPAEVGDEPSQMGNSIVKWTDLEASWRGPNDVGDPLQPEGHAYWALACTQKH